MRIGSSLWNARGMAAIAVVAAAAFLGTPAESSAQVAGDGYGVGYGPGYGLGGYGPGLGGYGPGFGPGLGVAYPSYANGFGSYYGAADWYDGAGDFGFGPSETGALDDFYEEGYEPYGGIGYGPTTGTTAPTSTTGTAVSTTERGDAPVDRDHNTIP